MNNFKTLPSHMSLKDPSNGWFWSVENKVIKFFVFEK